MPIKYSYYNLCKRIQGERAGLEKQKKKRTVKTGKLPDASLIKSGAKVS